MDGSLIKRDRVYKYVYKPKCKDTTRGDRGHQGNKPQIKITALLLFKVYNMYPKKLPVGN